MDRKLNTEEIKRVSCEEFRVLPKIPLVIVLDNIRSMNNVGAFFRTSDAFCVSRVVLCGITAVPPNKEIHKSALGAEFSVDWEYCSTSKEAVESLKKEGYIAIAVEQTEKSVLIDSFMIDPLMKYAVVFGNEVFGVEQETINLCEHCLEIPQFGTKHSLNVSVAGGIVVWYFFQQLQQSNI